MLPTQSGSFRLFAFRGITVFVHFSWFFVAAYALQARQKEYTSMVWNLAEYLSLFLIVLLHEFGHSFACRSVGGRAEQIVLWPLGGVAYVQPPERPGAQLWSIAAGPLVNVALWPVLYFALKSATDAGWYATAPDTWSLLRTIYYINLGLLIFNMLPVYPLDGGQILRSLLWYPLGRGRSLFIATSIGLLGALAMGVYAFQKERLWYGILAAFAFMTCFRSFKLSLEMMRAAKAPRRTEFACPQCRQSPPEGEHWTCGNCQQTFDLFGNDATCPHCQARFLGSTCPECREPSRYEQWRRSVVEV